MKSIITHIIKPFDAWFLSYKEYLPFKIKDIVEKNADITQPYAEIYFFKNFAIKVCQSQKFADYFRRTFNSQAKREYFSSKLLINLGINAPYIYAYSFNISPFSKNDSIFIMERIPDSKTLDIYLKETSNKDERAMVLSKIKKDIQIMINHSIYHKDGHFGNILIDSSLSIYWIDNDIRPIKESIHLTNFLKRFINSKLLSMEEKELFFLN